MAKNKICGIYKITNKINNKSYIGQSVNISKRWKAHLYYKKNKKNHPLYDSMNKYGLENFKFEVIEECSISYLNIKEIYYIEKYKSFISGFNLEAGGQANKTTSMETRLKQSKAKIGKKLSTETRKKMSESAKVKVFSEEHKKNLSIIRIKNIGKFGTHINFINAGKKTRKSVICIELNIEFKSIVHAATWLGNKNYASNISGVCRGKRKKCKGYTWKYKESLEAKYG